MITEKNHKLLTSQLFVTDCTKQGLASMQSYNRRYGKRDKVITGDMGKETKL
jgi:hypothetical protein